MAGKIFHHSTSQCDTTRMGQEVVVGFISTDNGQAGTAKVRVNGASSKSIAARLAQGQQWLQMTPHCPASLCSHLHSAAEHFLEYRALKWCSTHSAKHHIHHSYIFRIQKNFFPSAWPYQFYYPPSSIENQCSQASSQKPLKLDKTKGM